MVEFVSGTYQRSFAGLVFPIPENGYIFDFQRFPSGIMGWDAKRKLAMDIEADIHRQFESVRCRTSRFVYFPLGFANESSPTEQQFCFTEGG
uniref:Uncharacterized protein n=1 Tax=Candidatus Kentrum sp. LFY TaxID=2126342 RepID=A0A450WPN2_9GAMM|nr:MAG: hypothetical protein BECKLFY1418C_GA0070996_10523 [Candidatus Kentron sp. LFY]